MEFADLILASKVNSVILTTPLNRKLEGVLCITGHHLIVSSRKEGGQEVWYCQPENRFVFSLVLNGCVIVISLPQRNCSSVNFDWLRYCSKWKGKNLIRHILQCSNRITEKKTEKECSTDVLINIEIWFSRCIGKSLTLISLFLTLLWQLLHSNIDCIERKQASNLQHGGILIIKCKDLRVLQLELSNLDDFTNVAVSLERLVNIDDISKLYPFFYRPMYNMIEDGWTAFRPESEFNKLITTYPDEWRISYVNQDFQVCPSYPKAVIVPKSIDDETVTAVSNFREGGRFPTLSYRHRTGSVLMRSSQPLTGPNSKRCKEDVKLLNSLLCPGRSGYIIDTRTPSAAQNAKSKGGGFEHEMYYPLWKRIHKPIDRCQSLLDGLAKLVEACNDTLCSMDKWLSRVDSSGWLSNVREALDCACLIAQCLDQESSSILVHGQEGLDSTLLVTSLTQVILNPDCRTVRGMEALIEREWLQAGHPFSLRHRRSCYASSNVRSKSNAPTFLLFLDCLAQIHYQFPCSFEFNQHFLVTLFEHSYSSQFGTFLGNCEADRDRLKLSVNTVSLWSYLNRPEILQLHLNLMYEPNNSVIWPSVAPVSLSLWSECFLRWVLDHSAQEAASERMAELKAQDAELRQKAARLRRKLADLEREALDASLFNSPSSS